MNRRGKSLVWLFTLVMLLFSLGMALWVPLRARLDFQLADIRLSLETSRGRERKQQAEYDMVMEELPRVRAELAEAQPRAEAAAEEVKALKETRKALREKKKALEKEIQEQKETDQEAAASPDRPVEESENP
ncbi:MAG: hypothetical protein IKE24_01765 [Clostridia bacterium]|nr:hypothetical protein [Clostridia bacterium]